MTKRKFAGQEIFNERDFQGLSQDEIIERLENEIDLLIEIEEEGLVANRSGQIQYILDACRLLDKKSMREIAIYSDNWIFDFLSFEPKHWSYIIDFLNTLEEKDKDNVIWNILMYIDQIDQDSADDTGNRLIAANVTQQILTSLTDNNLRNLLLIDNEYCNGKAILATVAGICSDENAAISFWNRIPNEFKLQCLRYDEYCTIGLLLMSGLINTIEHIFSQISSNEQKQALQSVIFESSSFIQYKSTSLQWIRSKIGAIEWHILLATKNYSIFEGICKKAMYEPEYSQNHDIIQKIILEFPGDPNFKTIYDNVKAVHEQKVEECNSFLDKIFEIPSEDESLPMNIDTGEGDEWQVSKRQKTNHTIHPNLDFSKRQNKLSIAQKDYEKSFPQNVSQDMLIKNTKEEIDILNQRIEGEFKGKNISTEDDQILAILSYCKRLNKKSMREVAIYRNMFLFDCLLEKSEYWSYMAKFILCLTEEDKNTFATEILSYINAMQCMLIVRKSQTKIKQLYILNKSVK
ncbi:MAG: hypothetical protein J0G32_02325 [Alphaproteobacteria bacterium]|nr:hypothetical protein [Alphaproteobacteria bacterium]OJV12193.1 MAG: hypothetical protein BGO27_05590 [Alphaproteobacteria bacterium 33-17]